MAAPMLTLPTATTGFVAPSGEHFIWNHDDPASLEAWFGNFGHAEHFRKVVLASAREAERAKALLEKAPDGTAAPLKLSDDRADNRARCSDMYVEYLTATLIGRIARERNVLVSLIR